MYQLVSEQHGLVEVWRDVFAGLAADWSDPDRAWPDRRRGPLDGIRAVQSGLDEAQIGRLLDWLNSLPEDYRVALVSDSQREPLLRLLLDQSDNDLAACFAVSYQWRDGDRYVDGDVRAVFASGAWQQEEASAVAQPAAHESTWDEARRQYLSYDTETQQWLGWDDTAADWLPLAVAEPEAPDAVVSQPAVPQPTVPQPAVVEPAVVEPSAVPPEAVQPEAVQPEAVDPAVSEVGSEPVAVAEEVREISETVIGPAMDALYDDLPELARSLGVQESEVQAVLDALPAEFFADIAADAAAD
jgi:hypothetical protein